MLKHWHQGWRVVKVQVVEEAEVDEAEHGRVELDKDGHQLEVDALRLVVSEAVRNNPGHRLTHNLSLFSNFVKLFSSIRNKVAKLSVASIIKNNGSITDNSRSVIDDC